MLITFDPAKRDATKAVRGLDMADVAEIFVSPRLVIRDEREDYSEDRYVVFGLLKDRMVACVYTDRMDERRIISLRKANEREQARYRDLLV